MSEKELRYKRILDFINEGTDFAYTAGEIGEELGITSQSASGALRSLANQGKIWVKRIKAGRNEVNIYTKIEE